MLVALGLFASFHPKLALCCVRKSPIHYYCSLMLENEATVDLRHFCTVLFNLVSQSCQLLHKFSTTSLAWKGKDNPVTELDYLIQQFITSGISSAFGSDSVTVVAEQDLSYSLCPQFQKSVSAKLSEFPPTGKDLELPKCVQFKQKYERKELGVWIDPIDCTQGFINERLHQVTILVGISYKGSPICGIIGHPYKPNKKQSIYAPTVYFGSPQLKLGTAFEYSLNDNCWNVRPGVAGYQHQQTLRKMVAVGYRKMSARQENVVKNVGLSVVRAGGAGYKCLKVINRQVGSLIFIDAKTSKWDTCAGQAIIQAMGGFTLSQNSQQITYDTHKSYKNEIGFVFSLFSDIVQKVTELVS